MRLRKTFHVFLICLAFGISSDRLVDWLNFYLSEVQVSVPSASEELLVVTTRVADSGFQLIGHGCGGREEEGGGGRGYTTAFQSHEMTPVSVSGFGYDSNRKALRSIDRLIGQSSEVINDSRIAPDASRAKMRLELRFEHAGRSSYTILKYDGDTSFETIDSSRLETARDFEKWNELNEGKY